MPWSRNPGRVSSSFERQISRYGLSLRLPPKGQDWIVTTNHFRLRAAPTRCSRYGALADTLKSANRAGIIADGRLPWEDLAALAAL